MQGALSQNVLKFYAGDGPELGALNALAAKLDPSCAKWESDFCLCIDLAEPEVAADPLAVPTIVEDAP